MSNRKYVLSSRYIEYEDACLELFNKMNNEGYILKKIGIFFVFEKSDKKVKYQIDYTTRDIEYNAIIEQQGYIYIGSCNDVHYYYNEDLNALDLNTDLEVKKNILLKRHGVWVIILLATFILFSLVGCLYNLPSYFENPIKRYYQFKGFVFCIGILLFTIPLLGYCIYDLLKKRKAISEDAYTYDNFKKHDKFGGVLVLIVYISLIIAAALTSSTWIDFMYSFDIIIMSTFLRFFRNKFVEPNVNKDKRAFLNFVGFIIMFFMINVFTDYKINQDLNIPRNFPTDQFVYDKEENYVIYDLTAITNYTVGDTADFEMSTNYTECRNEKIANELFDRFLEVNPNIKIHSNVVDECYEYLEEPNYYIFKSGTILVRFEERDLNNLDTRILKFIEFYNNNKHF